MHSVTLMVEKHLVVTREKRGISPVDFMDVAYQPGLLLKASFPQFILSDPEYITACEWGFEDYFGDMVQGNTPETLTVVPRFYTRPEVAALLVENMTKMYSHDTCIDPLAIRVGFLHGWLSALALTDYQLASFGLQVLLRLLHLERHLVCHDHVSRELPSLSFAQ